MIKEARNSMSIVIVSSDMDEVDELSDKVVLMNNGQIRSVEEPLKIKKKYAPFYKIILRPLEDRDLGQFIRMRKQFHQFMVGGTYASIVELLPESSPAQLIYSFPFTKMSLLPEYMQAIEYSISESLLIEVEGASLDDAIVNFENIEEKKDLAEHEIKSRQAVEKEWVKDIQDLSRDYI
jgi:ABC-type multidrug transport system ATPase subunit